MSQKWDVAQFFRRLPVMEVGRFALIGVEETSSITFRMHFEPTQAPSEAMRRRFSQTVDVSWDADKEILSLHTTMPTEIPISEIDPATTFLNNYANQAGSGYVCRCSVLERQMHPNLQQVTLGIAYAIACNVAWMREAIYEQQMRALIVHHALHVFLEGADISFSMIETYQKSQRPT